MDPVFCDVECMRAPERDEGASSIEGWKTQRDSDHECIPYEYSVSLLSSWLWAYLFPKMADFLGDNPELRPFTCDSLALESAL